MAPQDDEPRGADAAASAALDAYFLDQVLKAADQRHAETLRALLRPLHPTDLADVIENAPEHARAEIMALVGAELPPEMLLELSEDIRVEVLELLANDYLGRALGEMDTDDAAVIAGSIGKERLPEVLASAPEDVRIAVESGLSFDEETAGRLMQREFVAAPEFWTVGHVIDHLRAVRDQLPDRFFEIYVVDPSFRPVGAIALSTIMRADRTTPIRTIMAPVQTLIHPEMDQEEVAFAFSRYHLASAPVVDEAGRLTGMLTVDDIVHVIEEESGEDLLRLSGVSEASQSDSVRRSVRARAPWLLLNLATAMFASTIIAMFEDSINKLVALAILMPIVSSLGGNAGTQSLAVAVRALAARELTVINAPRFVVRELITAAVNGLIVALLMGGVAGLWFQSPSLGMAAGLAVIINLACAGLAGSLVPLGLQRLGLDPAVASSVLVTWLTDTIGFLAFLGLATIFLFG